MRGGLDCGGGSRPDGFECDPLSPKQTDHWKPRLFDPLIFDKNSLQNSFCRDFVDVFEKFNSRR